MNKIAWITLLYDFYGQLLTDKQRRIIDHYYGDDFSLGEIAKELGISRQAVYDSIKRTEGVLNNYENKLGFVKRFLIQREKLSEVAKLLNQSDINNNLELILRARKILKEVLEIIET